MINFGATITAETVTFYGDAVNNGTITADTVVFEDSSRNGSSGVINGNATFNGADTDNFGTVNGPQTYDPPLLAKWILLKWSSDEPWIARQIGTYRVYGGQINQNYPYQACPYPNEGCYTQPELYREEFPNLPNFVIDYANHPEYNGGT